ncbi:MAG TPA: ribosome biogenesis GTPase Der [Candidatus Marinimicrobia bacterium]|nr:ribosome biogenesis GTPase Der [Candidatus Neomarinimicrobiota bacterium]
MRGTVAIVGRPNVGKSTLFNRFISKKKAIVDAQDGVTRDRSYGTARWQDTSFLLIDTGGIMISPKDSIETAIRSQAELAILEADVILFMVDILTGITEFDLEISRLLKRAKKSVILVSNKTDNEMRELSSAEFYRLGFGEPSSISALNGMGTGDLMERIMPLLPDKKMKRREDYTLRLALLGMPNAGKSTIANTFLGEERHIVTDIPGTTRDAIDSSFRYHNQDILLVDTAGLRRKARVTENVEFYSNVRTQKALAESDLAIVVVDAVKGFSKQDIRIIEMVIQKGRGLILAINKWDLIEKDDKTAKTLTEEFYHQFPPLEAYPVFFISAVKKQRLFKMLDEALAVKVRMNQYIKTSELNAFFQDKFKQTPPPAIKGKLITIKYVTQVSTNPPTLILFSNEPKLISETYKRYLEKEFRNAFDMKGVPLAIWFREK